MVGCTSMSAFRVISLLNRLLFLLFNYLSSELNQLSSAAFSETANGGDVFFSPLYGKIWGNLRKKQVKKKPHKHVKEELIKNTDSCKNNAACQML